MTTTSPPPAKGAPLAYRNPAFLESTDGRPIRIVSEYLQPLSAFRRQHVRDTIVFFGSARISETGPLGEYCAQARELARLVTEWSIGLDKRSCRYLVCTGGGPGIMEAANRGAQEAGGRTIGLNIGLPHEQRPNPYITKELAFKFRYFFMRKLWFAYLARAIVVFPGGFGTLDELFELLTLSQTGKLDRPIMVLLYGSRFWNEIVSFEALARHGMIAGSDLELVNFVDSPEQAFGVLRKLLRPQDEPDTDPAIAGSVTCDKAPSAAEASGGGAP